MAEGGKSSRPVRGRTVFGFHAFREAPAAKSPGSVAPEAMAEAPALWDDALGSFVLHCFSPRGAFREGDRCRMIIAVSSLLQHDAGPAWQMREIIVELGAPRSPTSIVLPRRGVDRDRSAHRNSRGAEGFLLRTARRLQVRHPRASSIAPLEAVLVSGRMCSRRMCKRRLVSARLPHGVELAVPPSAAPIVRRLFAQSDREFLGRRGVRESAETGKFPAAAVSHRGCERGRRR